MPRIRDRSLNHFATPAGAILTGGFSRALYAFGLVLLLALFLATSAHAETAKVQASEQDGYGRLILTFDNPPTLDAKVSGGVLVVSFSDPVDVNVETIGRDLPNFVSAARRDPDGRGVRLALSRPVKVNTMAAGEKLFIDLMPQKWVGMPPPLPPEVVQDLTRRALAAEQVKRELARAQTLPPVVMQLSAGTNAERMRLTFSFSDKMEVRFKHDGRHGILSVPGTTVFDAALARATLPPDITEFKAEVIGDILIVRFTAPEGKELRGLNEDRAFVVDIAPPGKFDVSTAVDIAPSAMVDGAEDAEVEGDVGIESVQRAGETPMQQKPSEVAALKPTEAPKPSETAKTSEVSKPFETQKPEDASVQTDAPKQAEAPKAAAAPPPQQVAEAPKPVDAPKQPEAPKPADAAPQAEAPKPAAQAVVSAEPVVPQAKADAAQPAKAEPAKPESEKAAQPAQAAPAKADAPAIDAAKADDPMMMLSQSERAMRSFAEQAQANGVQVRVEGSTTQIAFPFAQLPAAAAFFREKMLFVIFDGDVNLDTSLIVSNSGGLVSSVEKISTGAGTGFKIGLTQTRLSSLVASDKTWILSFGDTMLAPTKPVHLTADFAEDGRNSLKSKLDGLGTVHLVPDSRIGDQLYVVTLKSPTRGLVRDREFIEFAALRTVQGLAFEPHADDFQVKVSTSEVTLTRPKGLTISLDAEPKPFGAQVQLKPNSPFASEAWQKAQLATRETTNELARAAAAASPEERTKARVQLAKFYLANGNAAETKAILDIAALESPGVAEDPDLKLVRGTSLVMMRHFDEAAKILNSGEIAANGEAALWRTVAEAGLGHIALAREAFRKGEPVLDAMPPDLQRMFRQTMIEVNVAAQDYAAAAAQLDALDVLNVGEDWAMREVMRGRIAEGFDQPAIALESYRRVLESTDPRARAEAQLRATNLRYKMNEIQRKDAIANLESLATYWRGDSTEAVTLASLSDLYKDEHRWRDAFTTMRAAATYHPDDPSTREIQDTMTAEFAKLFLGEGKNAAPPTLESVALFYDFKELTPPGRKGDELIRKLADRLVEVDLLSQAADLLTYQVRNRLQGAARAQVAAHVAAIELMDRKPSQALNILHETRFVGLAPDVIRNRLILESRALSELQRPDIALEMIAAYTGPDVDRLRADIQWAANRWQAAADALELMLGETWRTPEPLTEIDRQDVLRAAIAYALAEDTLGLDRLRTKYGPKMAATPDQKTFDIVTAPVDIRNAEFEKVAKAIAVSDTLKKFLEDYRERYPETAPPSVRMKEDGKPGPTADATNPT